MVLAWVPFKIVSDRSSLHSRWLLLLKIEISSGELKIAETKTPFTHIDDRPLSWLFTDTSVIVAELN
jgi:hypothetical protein